MMKPLYAIVDVETTGGRPQLSRITEIGIVITDGIEVLETYTALINPEIPIDPFVQKLTGISNEMVKYQPTFSMLSEKILDLLDGKIFVAHNVLFDYGMMRRSFAACGIKWAPPKLCTIQLSRKFFPGLASYSLSNLGEYFNIIHPNKHRALADAMATQEVFKHIVEKTNQLQFSIETALEIPPSLVFKESFKKALAEMPDSSGLLYYKKEDAIICIHEGENLRDIFIKTLRKAPKFSKVQELLDQTDTVEWVEEPFSLFNEINYYQEIKKHNPSFSKASKYKNYTHQVYANLNADGFLELTHSKYNNEVNSPKLFATSKAQAEKLLQTLVQKHQLREHIAQQELYKKTNTHAAYNIKIEQILDQFFFPKASFTKEFKTPFDKNTYTIEVKNNILQSITISQDDFIKTIDYTPDANITAILSKWMK